MTDSRQHCPRCQRELKPDAPGGLCPARLMEINLQSGVSDSGGHGKAVPWSLDEVARRFPEMEVLGLIASANFYHKVHINVAFEDPKFKDLTFSVDSKRLSMTFEAAGLIPDASGKVTLRFGVSDPKAVARILAERGGKTDEPGGSPSANLPAK